MCATYVCVCLTSLPGVAPGDRASLTSDRRSYPGTFTTPMALNFCARAYPWGKTAKAVGRVSTHHLHSTPARPADPNPYTRYLVLLSMKSRVLITLL